MDRRGLSRCGGGIRSAKLVAAASAALLALLVSACGGDETGVEPVAVNQEDLTRLQPLVQRQPHHAIAPAPSRLRSRYRPANNPPTTSTTGSFVPAYVTHKD
jgi:hypothetical protein